jgi:chromosomal replication initiation ATPase DnaA
LTNEINFSVGTFLNKIARKIARKCNKKKWNPLTIIGGSGVGKSRLSYEVWNILKDYVQNHETICTKWLNDDKEIFSKFKERF